MSEPALPQKAPYVVSETPGKKYWCACGHSKNQPYCDGAHARVGSDLRPMPVEITEARRVAWCGCKRTAKAPHCDGSHNRLA